MIQLYVWPDGTWMDVCQYEENEYDFLGDDKMLVSVPSHWGDSRIDSYAYGYVNQLQVG